VKVLYAVMFSTLAVLLGERIMQYFLVWLLGYAISFIKPVQVPQKTLRLAITMLAALGAVVSLKYFYNKAHIKYPSFSTNQFIPDLSVGIAFAFLIYVLVSFYNGTGRRKRIQRFNLFRVLAGFSYTMYLTHYPILNFLGAWKGTVKWSSGPSIFIGIIVFVLLNAWVISRFTEGKTNRVRTFMVIHLTHAQPSVTSFKNSA
jgi:peptidoglycan/LPS O-acetylase OafA/YrhL